MPDPNLLMQRASQELYCEAKVPTTFGTKIPCQGRATHVYGPECETASGKLMYLCDAHAVGIQMWKDMHANDPVNCPTHGNIGKVKDYLVLSRMPK